MKKLVILLLCCYARFMNAQPPGIQWQKALGGNKSDIAYSIQQTTDGGFILAGCTASTDGDVTGYHGDASTFTYDFWVAKLDSDSNIIWQRALGGTNYDTAYSIQQTSDGGYVVAGGTKSNDGDVTGNHGGYDFWVVKLDEAGNMQWQKTIGTNDANGIELARAVRQTADGGYIVVGVADTNSSSTGDFPFLYGVQDYALVKLDPDGNIQWTKVYGGSGTDFAESIELTADGGYIIAGNSGSTNGQISGNHGMHDIWILKLDANGAVQWQKALGGSSMEGNAAVCQADDGNYIVSGYSSSNDGDVTGNHGMADFWVAKLNGNGNLIWQKSLGGTSNEFSWGLQCTLGGGCVVSGFSNSTDGDLSANYGPFGTNDFWVVKLDGNGNLHWQKSLGGSSSDEARAVQQTDDGGFIVAGNTGSNDIDVSNNHGSVDCWVVKLSYDELGVDELDVREVKLYPNPADRTLYFSGPLENVRIIDATGRSVLQKKYVEYLDVSQLPTGFYLLQANHPVNGFFAKKFVKR